MASFDYPAEAYNNSSAIEIIPLLHRMLVIESVLDIGCGNGIWLNEFKRSGVKTIVGVDGDYTQSGQLVIDKDCFIPHDLTTPLNLERKFDLVVCLEVAEHLPEEKAENLINSLRLHADTILFSAAIPGQKGNGHVNERFPSYWKAKFEIHGFAFYDLIRPAIWDNSKVQVWYKQNMFLVANPESVIANKYEKSMWTDFVHPELFEMVSRQAERAEIVEKGGAGIKIAFNALMKSIYQKVSK